MQSITGRTWDVRRRAPDAVFERAGAVPPLAVQILHNRGCRPEDMADALAGAELPHDPFLMSGMSAAVERVLRAVEAKERICVYADYDADGVTGAAVLLSAIASIGGSVTHYFPSRLEEGYGLNSNAVRAIHQNGAGLLISTDCGANAAVETELAAGLGMNVVVTDHHAVRTRLPAALAVLNPHNPDEPYPFPLLAGVGVAYKLSEALLLEAEAPGSIEPESLLDLAALGTVADVVPLVDENRWIVREGLDLMNRTPRPGVLALIEASGLAPGALTAKDLAFRLGPRINAAGRMAGADAGLDLLLATESSRARSLAAELNALNRERQVATSRVLDEALEASSGAPIALAHKDGWPLGVVGLVAGRLAEATGRPAYVSATWNGVARGSARGPDGFDVLASLDRCADHLSAYGGHARAAGFSFDPARLRDLHRSLLEDWERLPDKPEAPPPLRIDCRLLPESVGWETLALQYAMEPFGEGFPPPLFSVSGLSLGRATAVGNNQEHLKISFRDMPDFVSCIWFGSGKVVDGLAGGSRYDVAFRLARSSFNGEERIDMVVEDLRPAR